MVKYLLACICVSSTCMGINFPWGSSGTIESDLTVKNPEKFAQGKLIPQYLDKTEKYLSMIIKDTTLDVVAIKKQKRDAKKDKNAYNNASAKLAVLANISDLLNALSRRLRFSSGDEYYATIKTKYFKNLKELKNKESDPFNILKLDDLEKNRDCLYRYLSWNFPGQKSLAQVRALSHKNILTEIDGLKQAAFKKGLTESSPYVLLVREIGAFFNDELAKEEYDAFVDGANALNRLIIPDQKTRDGLSERLQTYSWVFVVRSSPKIT